MFEQNDQSKSERLMVVHSPAGICFKETRFVFEKSRRETLFYEANLHFLVIFNVVVSQDRRIRKSSRLGNRVLLTLNFQI